MKTKNSNIQNLCLIGLSAALMCIIAPLSIPMPLGVPMTMQTFILTVVAIILGAKRGAITVLIYILLGSFGLPVFSNFTGGWQMLVGPTGGFILSFPLMAYLTGLGADLHPRKKWALPLGITVGTILNFILGTILFCIVTESSILVGFTTCVLPFLPITIIKAILAYLIGIQIKHRLKSLEA